MKKRKKGICLGGGAFSWAGREAHEKTGSWKTFLSAASGPTKKPGAWQAFSSAAFGSTKKAFFIGPTHGRRKTLFSSAQQQAHADEKSCTFSWYFFSSDFFVGRPTTNSLFRGLLAHEKKPLSCSDPGRFTLQATTQKNRLPKPFKRQTFTPVWSRNEINNCDSLIFMVNHKKYIDCTVLCFQVPIKY